MIHRLRRLLSEAKLRLALKRALIEIEQLRMSITVLREDNARLEAERSRLADLELGDLREP